MEDTIYQLIWNETEQSNYLIKFNSSINFGHFCFKHFIIISHILSILFDHTYLIFKSDLILIKLFLGYIKSFDH